MATQTIDGITADFQEGGWYGGRQYWGGKLGSPGQIINPNQTGSGQQVSDDVIRQTSPSNVDFVRQQRQINASEISPPSELDITVETGQLDGMGLQDSVNKYRNQLERAITQRQEIVGADLEQRRQREQETLDLIGQESTPFRADLETQERERLYINQNFEANQQLVDELDSLLTEGNNLIRQQQEVTGLASVRNPRIQKTMEDVQARAGVIEAVINARNGQIAQAQNLIDRSINAITADRESRISYYNTILSLNNRDILDLSKESKELAEQQRNLIANDLSNAQAAANYLKELMLDPATVALMGEGGVKLNDSVETINKKLQTAQYSREVREQANAITLQGGQPVFDPKSVPESQLVTYTDSQGKKHYYKMPKSGTGSGFDTEAFISSLSQSGVSPDIGSIIVDVATDDKYSPPDPNAPNFNPAGGDGTVYVDPNTGITWRYTNNKWVRA